VFFTITISLGLCLPISNNLKLVSIRFITEIIQSQGSGQELYILSKLAQRQVHYQHAALVWISKLFNIMLFVLYEQFFFKFKFEYYLPLRAMDNGYLSTGMGTTNKSFLRMFAKKFLHNIVQNKVHCSRYNAK